eukprot:12340068-Ditylum_brightwellii.AAC.1
MDKPKKLAARAAIDGNLITNAPEGKTNEKKHANTKSAPQIINSVKKCANLAVARKDAKKKKAK